MARRRGSWLFRLTFVGLLVLLAWIAGLLWYATMLPQRVADPERETDAIVVLTGGSGRVAQGIELLAQGRAKKLFISGVYRGVDVEALLKLGRQTPDEFACCIALGYLADNTRGNALESIGWMNQEGYSSLRLVTASYHMPRSLVEFRRAMPNVTIVPHPVFSSRFKQDEWWLWPGSTYLLASEYTKYLLAQARAKTAEWLG